MVATTFTCTAQADVRSRSGAVTRAANVPAARGATSISQQTDNTPGVEGTSCGLNDDSATTENSYYRRFYLSEHGAGPSATVSAVTITVSSDLEHTALPITANLYTIPASTPVDTIPLAALTRIGTATQSIALPGGTSEAFTIPVSGTIADTAATNLVVEWTNGPDAVSEPQFFPGNNTAAETHPSFTRAPGCGDTDPVTLASVGDSSALVLIVEGSGLPVSLQQFKVD